MTDQEYLESVIATQIHAGLKDVVVPSCPFGRNWQITDTLFVDLTGFHGVNLIGEGSAYRGEPQFPGTVIDATAFNDRPALSVKGGRRCRIGKMSIIGANLEYAMSNGLGSINPAIDDRILDNWSGPNLAPASWERFNPYAAIALDPDPTKPGSSDVTFDDLWAGGFVAAYSSQAGGQDGNGDFVNFSLCNFEFNAYLFAVGNSQSRCLGGDNCHFNNYHTAFDNRTFGNQRGHFGGTWRNTSFESGIQLMDLNMDWAGPMIFDSCYAENLHSLGKVDGANVNTAAIRGGSWEIGQDPDRRGVTALHLEGQGVPLLVSDGAAIKTYAGFHTQHPVQCAGANFTTLRFDPSRGAPATQATVNVRRWTCGGLLVDPKNLVPGSTFAMRTPRLSPSGGWTGGAYRLVGEWVEDNGGAGAPMHMHTRMPARSRFGAVLQPQILGGPLADEKPRANFGYTDFSDPKACVLDVTNSFAALKYPASSGDLMTDSATGVAFMVTDITGNAWTLEALTGFEPDGSGGYQWATAYPDHTTGGLWKWYCTRVYTPAAPMLANLVQGQTTMVAGWESGPPHIPGDANYGTRVGDALLTDNVSFHPFPEGATVSAIDPVAGTITMSHGATRTVDLLPLTWWVRAPEAA